MRADFPPTTGSRVRLGQAKDFNLSGLRVSPARREAAFGGETRILEPRVMQVLVVLAECRPSVVSRDQLALACWGGLNVGDDAMNRCIVALRRLARDFDPQPFAIETVPRVGYSLIEAGASGEAPRPASSATEINSLEVRPPNKPLIGRRDAIIGSVAVVAVSAAGLSWRVLRGEQMPSEARGLVDDARRSLYEFDVEQTDNAVGKLRHAVELAPQSAEAWGLLAYAYMRAANIAPLTERQNLYARGRESNRQAFALDPQQADALAAQLWAMPLFRNWYSFEQVARASLGHNPEHPELNAILGFLLFQTGRYHEALPMFDKSLAEMPLSPPIQVARTIILWGLGRLDEAENAVSKAFELLPRQYGVWFIRLYFLMYNGQARKAAAMIDDKDRRPLGIPDWNYDLTAMQVKAFVSGDATDIRKALQVWKKAAERGTGFATNASIFAASVGDIGEAFRLLDGLYFNRGFVMADSYFSKEQGMYSGRERSTYHLFLPQTASIRRDRRFGILTQELGLDAYWVRTNSRSFVNG